MNSQSKLCRSAVPLAFALFLITTGPTPSQAETVPSCSEASHHGKRTKTHFAVDKACQDKTRGERTGARSGGPQEAAPTDPDAKYKVHSTVSGCFLNQASNEDYGACRDQAAKFCAEGEWIQNTTRDTRTPDADPLYSNPYCTSPNGSASNAAAGGTPVTIDEIRTLLVVKPKIESDNGGRGVRNAETNFYTLAEPTSLRTTIDGQLIELRATPITFTWDYGDGSAAVTTTEGGHAQPEFNTPTPTSHVYDETGSYTVGLTTVYIGEYRVTGGDWQLIPGTITMESAPVTADIWRTVTRNVADDCSGDSSAWGCTGPIDAPNGG